MYANLYGNLRYRPRFADFRVNLRDGTTGIFRCQRGGVPELAARAIH